MAVVVVLLNLPMNITPVCGCPPMDGEVIWTLNRLDTTVRLYAQDHDGYYPTYTELFLRADKEGRERLTPDVSMLTRTFYWL
jgi:hypothetical protein